MVWFENCAAAYSLDSIAQDLELLVYFSRQSRLTAPQRVDLDAFAGAGEPD